MKLPFEVRWVLNAEGRLEREHIEQTARGRKVTRYTSKGVILQWEFLAITSPGGG